MLILPQKLKGTSGDVPFWVELFRASVYLVLTTDGLGVRLGERVGVDHEHGDSWREAHDSDHETQEPVPDPGTSGNDHHRSPPYYILERS